MNTKAPIGMINIVHNGKVVVFDPSEFWDMSDLEGDPRGTYATAMEQFGRVTHWLAIIKHKQRGAENEAKAYAGRLYHSLKVEGGYMSKYRGSRPTEAAVDQAMWEDKTYREFQENISKLQEIADQLWGMQKTVQIKLDAIKATADFIKSAQIAHATELKHNAQSKP